MQPSVVYVLLVCRSFHVSSETRLSRPAAADTLLHERETLFTYVCTQCEYDGVKISTSFFFVVVFFLIVTKAVIVMSLLQQPTVI